MKNVSLRVVFGFWFSVFCVVGCGQTGPLYLPDHAQHSAGLAVKTSQAAKVKTLSVASLSASTLSTAASSMPASSAP